MFGAMIGLLFFLWGMAIPLSNAPAPIGPAAQEFADGVGELDENTPLELLIKRPGAGYLALKIEP